MDEKARPAIPALASAFDAHLELKDRARGTRLKYRHPLRTFAEWAGERSAADMAEADIEQYLASWKQHFIARHGRDPAPATFKAQITALAGFYR